MTVYEIAQVAYEANKAYCEALGDNSQLPWGESEPWKRKVVEQGVIFHINNPDATVDDSHNTWVENMKKDGWKYGPVKNNETKEHPSLISYEELSKEQKAKDYIFRQIVHSLARINNLNYII